MKLDRVVGSKSNLRMGRGGEKTPHEGWTAVSNAAEAFGGGSQLDELWGSATASGCTSGAASGGLYSYVRSCVRCFTRRHSHFAVTSTLHLAGPVAGWTVRVLYFYSYSIPQYVRIVPQPRSGPKQAREMRLRLRPRQPRFWDFNESRPAVVVLALTRIAATSGRSRPHKEGRRSSRHSGFRLPCLRRAG